jgi:hypothetical protein
MGEGWGGGALHQPVRHGSALPPAPAPLHPSCPASATPARGQGRPGREGAHLSARRPLRVAIISASFSALSRWLARLQPAASPSSAYTASSCTCTCSPRSWACGRAKMGLRGGRVPRKVVKEGRREGRQAQRSALGEGSRPCTPGAAMTRQAAEGRAAAAACCAATQGAGTDTGQAVGAHPAGMARQAIAGPHLHDRLRLGSLRSTLRLHSCPHAGAHWRQHGAAWRWLLLRLCRRHGHHWRGLAAGE